MKIIPVSNVKIIILAKLLVYDWKVLLCGSKIVFCKVKLNKTRLRQNLISNVKGSLSYIELPFYSVTGMSYI